jgi:colanic acid biosynthesis glycosyl transferase WcaI
MASARPILAVTPPESEIAQLVQETRCGLNVPPGQPQTLAQAILRLERRIEQLSEMGQNGRSTLENRFSRASCVNLFESMLHSICA